MSIRLPHVVVAGAILATGAALWAAAPQPPATDPAPAATPGPATGAALPGARGGRGGAGGRAGGGRAGGAPAVVVAPLPDAQTVELTPPLDKNGNFKVAPITAWRDVQGIRVPTDTPRGTVTAFQLTGAASVAVAGRGGAAGGGGTRNCWVYVPAGYKEGTELPLMVDHDGGANAVVQTQLIAAMDILIAARKIPIMGAVFIAPVQRSAEYDTASGVYADYIEKQVLPVAEKTGHVTFTKDPDGRGAIGQSSGSPAAMGMAWFHTPAFNRIISYSGSFTQIQKSSTAPKGAQEYQDSLIPTSDKKPIRIWMEVGANDLNNQFGDLYSLARKVCPATSKAASNARPCSRPWNGSGRPIHPNDPPNGFLPTRARPRQPAIAFHPLAA